MVDHYPDQCPDCLAALSSDLAAEVVGTYDRIDLPAISPFIERHQRLAVRCPACDARVLAAVPEAASGSPFRTAPARLGDLPEDLPSFLI